MPSKEAHCRAVLENARVIDHLLSAEQPMPQWVVTVAFYKALHVVEAVFAADDKSPTNHTDDHRQRNRVLKSQNRYRKLWNHYRPLWNDSLIARYLYSDSGTFEDFSCYMPMDIVEEVHLRHNLPQIIASARKLVGDDTFLGDENC